MLGYISTASCLLASYETDRIGTALGKTATQPK